MSRLFFIGICVFGVIAISITALSEFQRLKTGDAVLSRRQSRWRIISSVLWIIILSSLAYATAYLWPDEGTPREVQLRFMRIVVGAIALMVPAIILLALDLRFTMLAQKLSRMKFEAGLEEITRQEIAKAQKMKRESTQAVENSEEIK
jgi:MFS family permease